MKAVFTSILILIITLPFVGCRRDDPVVVGPTPTTLVSPPGFPLMEIPDDNRPYTERIELGRKLYYDVELSNSGISCSSCHVRENGFTTNSADPGMPVLPHVNMAWKSHFMWDGRKQGTLEDVMLFEVTEFFQTDVSKFNDDPEYVHLFERAFGAGPITEEKMAMALAQFARTQISASSKYDLVQAGQASFTADEQAGFILFNSEAGSCSHCHTPPLFTDDFLHNNGVDSSYALEANRGYFNTSGDSTDLGRMRTPTLRNVGLRSRFMHDGRYATLREVLDHYNSGVKRSPSLDPVMIKFNGTHLNLSETELDQIEAFLHTLTDTVFTSNPALGAPE